MTLIPIISLNLMNILFKRKPTPLNYHVSGQNIFVSVSKILDFFIDDRINKGSAEKITDTELIS